MRDPDDPSTYAALDPGGMGRLLEDFPRLCQDGWDAAGRLPLPEDYRRVSRIAFVGMGGSAVAGEMAAGLLRLRPGAPVTAVHRDYGVPPGVDRDTLVVLSSYSGETEETLSGVEPALARGAKLLALTRGGRLAQEARDRGFPCYPIALDAPPRAALPYTLTSLMRLLGDLGLDHHRADEMAEARHLLAERQRALAPSVPAERNDAKRLARRLHGRVPVIYGGGLFSAVARRWKTQVNENAKAWAFAEELPEAHHNSIVGLDHPADLRERLFVVLLPPPAAHPRIALRFQITREALAEARVPHELVATPGETPLAQLLGATLYGDYVSYYLALLNGVAPTPVPAIDRVKGRLSEG